MDWLSFLIGALVGWLIGWLIDIVFCRPRRKGVEADLNARLVDLERESAVLRARLTDGSDVKFQAGRSDAELESLRVQLAGATSELAAMKDLRAELDSARAELATLRNERAGTQDVQVRFNEAKDALDLGLPEPVVAPAVDLAGALPLVSPDKPDDLTIIEGIGPKINALFKQHGIFTFAQLAEASLDRLQSVLSSGGSRFAIADPSTWAEQARMARDGEWDALKRFQDSFKAGRE